jgi:hypothetical protein
MPAFSLRSMLGIRPPCLTRRSASPGIGSIAGAAVGGWVLGTNLPVRNIYAVPAVCPAVFAICIYLIGRMHSSILGREALAVVAPRATVLAGIK